MPVEVPFSVLVTGVFTLDTRNESKAEHVKQALRVLHFRQAAESLEKSLQQDSSSLKTYLNKNFKKNIPIFLDHTAAFRIPAERILELLELDGNSFTFRIPFIVKVDGDKNFRPGVLRSNIQSASEEIIQLAKESFKSKHFSGINARIQVFPNSANRTNGATRRNRKNRKATRRNTQRRG